MTAGFASALGIVVLNRKYFPRDALTAAQVGASAFTITVLRILLKANILSGVVLYSRDESLTEAHCEVEPQWNGVPVVTVFFNFRMRQSTVASALSAAFNHTLTRKRRHLSPIVYYQTDTLLQYHPEGYEFCVTHHGPFVSHFTHEFSPDLAELAFSGDAGKVNILYQQQRSGIDRLLDDSRGTVLAHSGLQQRVLEEEGLQSTRFKSLRPPIGVPPAEDPSLLEQEMRDFIAGADILLFTAVARLDYFKNVDLLVQTGVELLHRGTPVRCLVVGDPEGDETRRQALLESVPQQYRQNFLILPRLPKDQLYALFTATRSNGIFLCPSRYETLGITPLEAAASGVTTLMTETSNVEALAYLPIACHVLNTPCEIAMRVQKVYQEGIENWAAMVKGYVQPRTSLEGFASDLLQAWAEMSRNMEPESPAISRNPPNYKRRKSSVPTIPIGHSLADILRHLPMLNIVQST
jgi:glycosyltransferase involved in cell wall biosynthesis